MSLCTPRSVDRRADASIPTPTNGPRVFARYGLLRFVRTPAREGNDPSAIDCLPESDAAPRRRSELVPGRSLGAAPDPSCSGGRGLSALVTPPAGADSATATLVRALSRDAVRSVNSTRCVAACRTTTGTAQENDCPLTIGATARMVYEPTGSVMTRFPSSPVTPVTESVLPTFCATILRCGIGLTV
jgi:hypothetical protein